jgi:hypothetical protein
VHKNGFNIDDISISAAELNTPTTANPSQIIGCGSMVAALFALSGLHCIVVVQ